MSDLPVVLSTREAARVLGVTVRTVQRFADDGTLVPAYRFEGKRGAYLFHESDVTALWRARRKRAA